MTRQRLAIIGIDHYHATGWAETALQIPDRIEIVALYDPNPAAVAAFAPRDRDPRLSPAMPEVLRDRARYTDLDRLVEEQRPDIALVVLHNDRAPAAIERLARASIHILVDKPAARSADDARRAFAAAREAGVKVAVGLNKRYAPHWRAAKALVIDGKLGPLIGAEAIMVTSSVAVRNPTNYLFKGEVSGGGILHWLGIHDLDAICWLAGERVVEVQAMAGTFGDTSIDVEDVISVALRFAGGAIGTVHYAYALPRAGYDGYVALRGRNGSLKLSTGGAGAENVLEWIGAGSLADPDPIAVERRTYTTPEVPGYGLAALLALEDLLAAIAENRDPVVTGEDLTAALELVGAAYESARTGQRVNLG